MSKAYADALKKDENLNMRAWLKRPGKRNKNGSIQYFTEQAHAPECDVMNIIRKYDKTGVISHISKIEAKFGDMTGLDFKIMNDKVLEAKKMFDGLPSEIRKEFNNSPAQLLSFMDDENNRDKAIELGLINADWTEATDGIGEYVPAGGNENKNDDLNDDTKTASSGDNNAL